MAFIHISSFDYLQNKPEHPIHPAFKKWVDDAAADNIHVVWVLSNDKKTLPIAVHYASGAKHNGATITYMELDKDGKSFKTETIARLQTEEKKHLMKKNEDILQVGWWPDDGKWLKANGDVFKMKGNATYHHSKGDAGVRRLTEGFTHDGTQTVWEVQNDKSLEIQEEGGHRVVGHIKANEKIAGYDVQSPIHLEKDLKSTYSTTWRNRFIAHAIIAIMIMPIDRPANMTKALWWLKELGGIVIPAIPGALP